MKFDWFNWVVDLLTVGTSSACLCFLLWDWQKIRSEGLRRWTLFHYLLSGAVLMYGWTTLSAVLFINRSENNSFVVSFFAYSFLVYMAWTRGKPLPGDVQVVRGSNVVSGAKISKKMKHVAPSAQTITIGEIPIPSSLEAQHVLFSGTTGSGKTQAINKVLKTVRARKKRALIADAGGGFLAHFYAPGDVLFNPFDSRSVAWSPFAEIRAEYDCQRLAKAVIPDGFGDAQEWHHYAQTLLAEVMLALCQREVRSVKKLMYYLTAAGSKELAELLFETPAAILCTPGNEKMLGNTRGIISTYLIAWRYLPDNGTFSVRDWVSNDTGSGWLFITYRDDQIGLLRVLVATLLELGIVEGLSLSEDPERDLWFIFDEVDSLGKVTSLKAGLTKLRKYGCKLVLGLQTISQLRTTYGKDEAQTLLANLSTKMILRAGDGETAEYFSQEFGEQEIERYQTSHSQSHNWMAKDGGSGATTYSTGHEHRRTVLASEIASLTNLDGFLKMPESPILRVSLPFEKLPKIHESFIDGGGGRIRTAQDVVKQTEK